MMGCILLQYLQKGNNNNHFAVKPTTRREDFSPHTRDNIEANRCYAVYTVRHNPTTRSYVHKHGMSILSWVSPAWLM